MKAVKNRCAWRLVQEQYALRQLEVVVRHRRNCSVESYLDTLRCKMLAGWQARATLLAAARKQQEKTVRNSLTHSLKYLTRHRAAARAFRRARVSAQQVCLVRWLQSCRDASSSRKALSGRWAKVLQEMPRRMERRETAVLCDGLGGDANVVLMDSFCRAPHWRRG